MTREKDLTSKGKSPLIQGFQRAVKVETLPDETTMRDYNTGMQKLHSEVDKAVSAHVFSTHVFVEEAARNWYKCCEEFLNECVVAPFGERAVYEVEFAYNYFSKSSRMTKDGVLKPMILEAVVLLRAIPYYHIFYYEEGGSLVFEATPSHMESMLN